MNVIDTAGQTAAQAGWRLSRYILSAQLPGEDRTAVVSLMKGRCEAFSPAELLALSALDRLPEESPLLRRLKQAGVIVRYDERAALEAMSRAACAGARTASLTLAPTMACNFDCPYCFETHRTGKMTPDVQDAVVTLAERMLTASRAKRLTVTWFGGEPLLATDVIESLSARLIALAEERGALYSASVITNGYLLTQETVELLSRVRVEWAQITLDGIGAAHDATRRLAGGGPTFDRIVENLRHLRIPFRVSIRHNVHAGNRAEIGPLRKLVTELAGTSGNRISYYPSPVRTSDTAEARGERLGLLCGETDDELGLAQSVRRFGPARGAYCGAQSLWFVGVDEQGRLCKCWEDIGRPERSFGTAAAWDPADPLSTAERPDRAVAYLNSAGALNDPDCQECVWLPLCSGGCPAQRLAGNRTCVPYKRDPSSFVLAVWQRRQEIKSDNQKGEHTMKHSEKDELLSREEQDKELSRDELAQIAGGTGEEPPVSDDGDESTMEQTTNGMGGLGGYGNRGKRKP